MKRFNVPSPEDERDPRHGTVFLARVAACPNTDAFVSRALRISPVVRSEAKAAGRTKDKYGYCSRREQFTSLVRWRRRLPSQRCAGASCTPVSKD